jgi:hypothetical protein
MIARVPVAAGEDRQPLAARERKVTIEHRDHLVAAGDREGAARQEILLDIHDQHGIVLVHG